jgi:phage I-like protein
MPGIDETDKSWRVRQRDPGDFEEGSFKTIDITDGVKAVVGRLKGEKSTTVQSLIFDKEKFKTEAEVRKWVEDHDYKVMAAVQRACRGISLMIVDLAAYRTELQEDVATQVEERTGCWIEAHKVGKWQHEFYGEVVGSLKMFRAMIKNWKDNVLGCKPVIDYQHSTGNPFLAPEDAGKAAGWVENMKIEGDSLMEFIEWTPKAREYIRAGEFKYFSPTYIENYINPADGEDVGPVMLGGALTNTPFLPLNEGGIVLSAAPYLGARRDQKTDPPVRTGDQAVDKPKGGKAMFKFYEDLGKELEKIQSEDQALAFAAEFLSKATRKEPTEAERAQAAQLVEMSRKVRGMEDDALVKALSAASKEGRLIPPAAIELAKKVIAAEKLDGEIALSATEKAANVREAIVKILAAIRDTGLVQTGQAAGAESTEGKPASGQDDGKTLLLANIVVTPEMRLEIENRLLGVPGSANRRDMDRKKATITDEDIRKSVAVERAMAQFNLKRQEAYRKVLLVNA